MFKKTVLINIKNYQLITFRCLNSLQQHDMDAPQPLAISNNNDFTNSNYETSIQNALPSSKYSVINKYFQSYLFRNFFKSFY